jgi:glycosyltransferase involved in cell wall biosynthesis
MPRVLVVSVDRVAPEMAGPGIRALELARALARRHDVALAVPAGSSSVEDAVEMRFYDPERPRQLRRALDAYDVFVAPPLPPAATAGVRARWIVDLYNPEPFEGLSHSAGRLRLERRVRAAARIDRVLVAARHGACFVCASERQRDMWLGFLAASRRLDSSMYRQDPDLRMLIDVVPFGVPRLPPERRGEGLRGSVFPEDARIMVWNGGLWDWFDPETVLEALVRLRRKDASWRLAFSGIGRPSHRARMRTSERVLRLVDKLGLGNERAIHSREWTPYAERAAPLLDADIGVSAHHASLEARFAHRTRMLDLVWTQTPILCTEGDEWSEIVVAEGLGEAVPPGDPDALADGACRIAGRGRESYAKAFRAAASGRRWDATVVPLLGLVDTVASSPPRRPDLVTRALTVRHSFAAAMNRTVRYGRA